MAGIFVGVVFESRRCCVRRIVPIHTWPKKAQLPERLPHSCPQRTSRAVEYSVLDRQRGLPPPLHASRRRFFLPPSRHEPAHLPPSPSLLKPGHHLNPHPPLVPVVVDHLVRRGLLAPPSRLQRPSPPHGPGGGGVGWGRRDGRTGASLAAAAAATAAVATTTADSPLQCVGCVVDCAVRGRTAPWRAGKGRTWPAGGLYGRQRARRRVRVWLDAEWESAPCGGGPAWVWPHCQVRLHGCRRAPTVGLAWRRLEFLAGHVDDPSAALVTFPPAGYIRGRRPLVERPGRAHRCRHPLLATTTLLPLFLLLRAPPGVRSPQPLLGAALETPLSSWTWLGRSS